MIHNVNVKDYGFTDAVGCGVIGPAELCNATESKVGWGIDAGVKVNLPSFGAGDDFNPHRRLHPERRFGIRVCRTR